MADLAEFVRGRTSDSAVFVVGVGIGGEVAFQVLTPLHVPEPHVSTVAPRNLEKNAPQPYKTDIFRQAMQASKKITGAVCNGLLLPSEVAMVRHGGGFFRGWMGEVLEVTIPKIAGSRFETVHLTLSGVDG